MGQVIRTQLEKALNRKILDFRKKHGDTPHTATDIMAVLDGLNNDYLDHMGKLTRIELP